MKLSIAMATYNGDAYLHDQLRSFLNQTRLPDEVVIADDGSTDGTINVLREFEECAPFPVFIIRNRGRRGVTGNFNRALHSTTGDLVFLSDQDDVWYQNKLERFEKMVIENSDPFVFMCDSDIMTPEGQVLGLTKMEQIRSAKLSEEAFVMGCCAAIKREFLELVLPIPSEYPAHDSWIVRMAVGIERRFLIQETLQGYRRHSTNVSNSVAASKRKINQFSVVMDRFKKYANEGDYATEEVNGISKAEKSEYIFLQGVNRAATRAGNLISAKLQQFSDRLCEKLAFMAKRRELRKKPRLLRVSGVVRLYCKGGYHALSGWQGIMRDLFLK